MKRGIVSRMQFPRRLPDVLSEAGVNPVLMESRFLRSISRHVSRIFETGRIFSTWLHP